MTYPLHKTISVLTLYNKLPSFFPPLQNKTRTKRFSTSLFTVMVLSVNIATPSKYNMQHFAPKELIKLKLIRIHRSTRGTDRSERTAHHKFGL
jgi:hypothetical protein